MPEFNAIQTDRLENLVRRLLSVRNGGIMPTVAPELGVELAVPSLEDVLALGGYWRFGWAQTQNAVAGELAYGGIYNGSQNQLLGVRLTVSSNANAAFQLILFDLLGLAFDTLLPPSQGNWLDTRRDHLSFPLGTPLQIGDGTVAAIPGTGWLVAHARVLANTPYTFPLVVLAPGTELIAVNQTANQELLTSGEAWLRDAAPDELAGV